MGTLERFAADASDVVRRGAASNPAASPSLLHRLVDGCLSHATDPAAQRGRTTADTLATSAKWEITAAAAANPNCSEATLRQLVGHKLFAVVAHAAANPACWAELLEELTSSPEQDTRAAVAANPNSGLGLLDRLARDAHPDVRAAAAANPNCGISTTAKLLTDTTIEVRAAAAALLGTKTR